MTTALPANVTIVDLPVGTTITGVEAIEAVQTTNGVGLSVKFSLNSVAAFAGTALLPIAISSLAKGTTALPIVGQGTATPPAYAVLTVPGGGIGTTTLTSNAVVLGAGTSALQVAAAATAGAAFISQGTTSNPSFNVIIGDLTLTSGGTATVGANAITYSKFQTGTGLSVLGVAGTAVANFSALTGVQDQVLRVAQNGTTLGFGAVNLATTVAVTGVLAVPSGGIGTASLPLDGVVLGNSTSALAVVAATTANNVLTSQGSTTPPAWTPLGLMAGGRLTLTNGAPVMTSSVTAQSTIYYAPYAASGRGPFVPIYNGTTHQLYSFLTSTTSTTGLSLALGTNWVATGVYDFVVFLNGTTVTLGTMPAWTNNTTRAATLSYLNGLLTNNALATVRISNATTVNVSANQALYLGSGYINGTAGQIDYNFGGQASGGTPASFGLWNMFNRVETVANVIDSASQYLYTSATVRQANGTTGNQIKFILGLQEDGITVGAVTANIFTTAQAATMSIGVGLDTTSSYSPTTSVTDQSGTSANTRISALSLSVTSFATLGVHTLARLEQGDGVNGNSFNWGNNGTLSARIRM